RFPATGTVSMWPATTTRSLRPREVRATTALPSRMTSRCRRSRRDASMRSASSRSPPLTDSTSTICAARTSARCVRSSPMRVEPPSGVDTVLAQDVVELRLVVALPFLQPLEHQYARQAEGAAGELLLPGAAHGDAPVGDAAPADLLTGLHVDHRHGRRQDRARADDGAPAHPGPFDDHGAAAEQRVVLDDHGHGVRRFEYAADADTAGQVHVLADLRARPGRGPGVDHGAGVHVGAD